MSWSSCAEQGFVGTFNQRVLDAAETHLKAGSAELLVVGDRGAMVAAERGLVFGWSAPMVAHAEEVPMLASRITDALYSRLERRQARRVTVVHAVPAPSASIEVVERMLLPFDFARFKVTPHSVLPITTLPSEQLLAELAEEYVYAELCEEVMLSFAAENEARMQAMIAARSNVSRKLDELVASFRRLRQEEITGAKIIELLRRQHLGRARRPPSTESARAAPEASSEPLGRNGMKARDVDDPRRRIGRARHARPQDRGTRFSSKAASVRSRSSTASGAPLGIVVSEGDLLGRREARARSAAGLVVDDPGRRRRGESRVTDEL